MLINTHNVHFLISDKNPRQGQGVFEGEKENLCCRFSLKTSLVGLNLNCKLQVQGIPLLKPCLFYSDFVAYIFIYPSVFCNNFAVEAREQSCKNVPDRC